MTETRSATGVETTVRRTPASVHLSRSLPAPPSTVFRALSEEKHLLRWWGPPTCRVVECSVDFRVGGVWHYRLLSPDGTEHWSRAVYREIVPDQRIVYVETGSDAAGNVVHDRPVTVATIRLVPAGRSTRLDVDLVYASRLDRDRAIANGAVAGFGAALEQLVELLAGSFSQTAPEPSPHHRHVVPRMP